MRAASEAASMKARISAAETGEGEEEPLTGPAVYGRDSVKPAGVGAEADRADHLAQVVANGREGQVELDRGAVAAADRGSFLDHAPGAAQTGEQVGRSAGRAVARAGLEQVR